MAAMAGKTKTVDGKPLAADKFAMVGDPDDISTWHLPIDDAHIDSALDMFGHETHGTGDQKSAAARKIAAAARAKGIDSDRIKNFESKYCKSAQHGEAPRPWFEIFRAGDYSKAGKGTITPDDLKRVASNYDPTYHEAPETLGHRSDDQPAYGWIDALMLDGDKLLARERQVDPKFDEARKAGKFKKRSAAFYTNEDGQVTGLRHLAWLGAGIPEVKGLEDVAFDDHGSKFITVDFGEDDAVAAETKTVADEIRDFFARTFGAKGAEKTFSEEDAKRIAAEVAAPLQTKITELQTSLQTQATKFAEREAALAGGEVKQRATAAVARLKTAGKWVPAFEKMGLGLVFDELAKATTTIEFGEGDAKKKVTPLETLVLFLEGLPKIVPGGRVVDGSQAAGRPAKGTGDPLSDAAKALQKEKKITFGEALAQVAEEHPELINAGTAAGGAV